MYIPAPHKVHGVAQSVLLLDGLWQYNPEPPAEWWRSSGAAPGWRPVHVPGEPAMQGLPVHQDYEQAYRTEITCPADFIGQRCVLRFDGVYDYARLFVNGLFVRDHLGGFTRWEADVTDLVGPEMALHLCVGVTDRSESIASASYYAGHNIGGILRSVRLMAVPPVHIRQLHVRTELDPSPGAATLRAEILTSLGVPGVPDTRALLRLTLIDPMGELVGPGSQTLEVRPEVAKVGFTLGLKSPRLWTAESPQLYTLRAELEGQSSIEVVEQRVGVREVAVAGNQLLVNGHPVHLRGVNHHDIHPLLGRSGDDALDWEDVRLLKDANVNFIRTSHYPPNPALLEAADELGMYVEVENAVCWAGTEGRPSTQDDRNRRDEYSGQMAETVERDRNHPSVIIWSLGNESVWGSNFVDELKLLRSQDCTRPVIMSYPDGAVGVDIKSVHYPAFGTVLSSEDEPVLYDEAAHVVCYRQGDLRRDPAVQVDWGETLYGLVEAMERSPGALGLAIWAGVDEIFELPERVGGYGPWGIVDIWRRRKPEWWSVKRAYSPVRVRSIKQTRGQLASPSGAASEGGAVVLELENRYDTLNLSVLSMFWRLGTSSGALRLPDVPPRGNGVIHIPVPDEPDGEFSIQVIGPTGRLVDEFTTRFGNASPAATISARRHRKEPSGLIRPVPWARSGELAVARALDGNAVIEVDALLGMIRRVTLDGEDILLGGPRLHLAGLHLPPFELNDFYIPATDPTELHITGHHGPLEVAFRARALMDGQLETSYHLGGEVPEAPFGLTELGLSFDLAPRTDRVDWCAAVPPWVTPGHHLARRAGTARLCSVGSAVRYRAKPDRPWEGDGWDTALEGPGAPDGWAREARARRDGPGRLQVTGPGGHGVAIDLLDNQSARLMPAVETVLPGDPRISLSGDWALKAPVQTGDFASHYGPNLVGRGADVEARIAFVGTGIDWVASRCPGGARADVWVDGDLAGTALDTSSTGHYHEAVLFSVSGLAHGAHELRITTAQRGRYIDRSELALAFAVVYPEAPWPPRLAVLDHHSFPWDRFAWADPCLSSNVGRMRYAHGTITLGLVTELPSR